MNKQKQGRKFSRTSDQRKALLQSLGRALILRGKVETTEAKAKQLRLFVEPMITISKTDTVHKRRMISKRMGDDIVKKLFAEVGLRFKDRNGGYTRITKKIRRKGDAASMAVIELV